MADPYRDPERPCPACDQPLRAYHQRLVCDACNGIMVSVEDLSGAIEDLTSVTPTFAWDHEKPSSRKCPQCRAPMVGCRVVLEIEGEVAHPRPELDRCAAHGVWFDREELAKVLEKVAGKGHGSKVVSKVTSRREGDPDQGRWSAMFPKFGGRGGF